MNALDLFYTYAYFYLAQNIFSFIKLLLKSKEETKEIIEVSQEMAIDEMNKGETPKMILTIFDGAWVVVGLFTPMKLYFFFICLTTVAILWIALNYRGENNRTLFLLVRFLKIAAVSVLLLQILNL